MHCFKDWFHRILLSNNPIFCHGGGSFQGVDEAYLRLWNKSFQALYIALRVVFQRCRSFWGQYAMVSQSPARDYCPLEVLPDYYLNYDHAKRLWQDWRVLRRLFVRRDHSRDLLLQGESGWLPIHGMLVNQQMVTITTDEGETVFALDESVVWLSRANPANTKITQTPMGTTGQWNHSSWCPVT